MPDRIRKFLLAPLIYLAAILLLFEEWLWRTSKRMLARLPRLLWMMRLEAWIARRSPYTALLIFAAPTLLLLPVKLLALLSIAHGHPGLGLLIVLAAKVVGTILVARLYTLTQQSLSSLDWFDRWRDGVLRFKDRVIAQLRATRAWQHIQHGIATLRAAQHHWRQVWRARWQARRGKVRANRLRRLAKRIAAKWRGQM